MLELMSRLPNDVLEMMAHISVLSQTLRHFKTHVFLDILSTEHFEINMKISSPAPWSVGTTKHK